MSGSEKPLPDESQFTALLYALGELDEAGRAEFESHLRTDDVAGAGLAEVVETILASASALEMSSRQNGLGQAAARAARTRRWKLSAAVALGLLVALVGFRWMREHGPANPANGGIDGGALAEVAEQWVDVRDAGAADFASFPGDREELVLAWMGVEDESEALGLPDWMVIAVEAPEAESRP